MRNIGKKNTGKLQDIFVNYLQNNLREYCIVILIFLIGLIIGIIFVNNANQTQIEEINNYLTTFVNQLKENAQIDKGALLKNSLISNFILTLLLWFVGSTVIGIPIVYTIIGYRGFCIGYTISSSIAALGVGNGILFVVTSILFQNILFIPCILALGVSGMKLYKSIVKDKRKENIKMEITRHTIFCVFILVLLEISSFVEVYISSNLLQVCARYL